MGNNRLEFAKNEDGSYTRLWFVEGVTAQRTETVPHVHTASGYGGKLPTQWKVRIGNDWYRVYAACYSNASTAYIRRQGYKWVVEIEEKPYEAPSPQVWELWNTRNARGE